MNLNIREMLPKERDYVPYYVSYIAIWAMENQKWRYYCGCQK